ncbi:MAG: TIGR00730 family Rossman fold protein [Xanthobacteraceae bacterium]|nr:TIGR00730 family Rossman fold protein [Xanthobacteraceae bacterium]
MKKTNDNIKTVCVYCGSGPGTDPQFIEAASAFGKTLAENGIRLVYGGGSIGLMGAVARGVLDHGGEVTGIIPDFLTARENAMERVQELIVTKNMHERKQLMFDRSDAFVAFPGGIGTLEELVEQMTWAQLGRHTKPILLANIANFWEPLLSLISHMRQTEFIRQGLSVNILTANHVADILPKLREAAARYEKPVKELVPEVAGKLA